MNGQWIGKYSGDNNGTLVFDVDDVGDHYEGYGYVYENTEDISVRPAACIGIKTFNKYSPYSILSVVLDPLSKLPIGSATQNRDVQLNGILSSIIEISITEGENKLEVQWQLGSVMSGNATLEKSQADNPTNYLPIADVTNWETFKKYVSALGFRRYLFRGQRELKRLRTSFHRTGRADLERFLRDDIQYLHRQLSAKTTHIFNLEIGNENGAFFNLVQHHGYPTPLLDWTYSPYVSAFFAYRRITNPDARNASPEDKVRIFIFDQQEWNNKLSRKNKITDEGHHFSILEFIAINNERMIPQQAISTVTNIDDIESFIRSKESETTKFLQIIDLPYSERSMVMKELSSMGITAGSLFPGFDGTCEEIKERFFSC